MPTAQQLAYDSANAVTKMQNDRAATNSGYAGGGSYLEGGTKPVSAFSSQNGADAINGAIDAHKNDMTNLTPAPVTGDKNATYGGDTNPAASKSFIDSFKSAGAITANEAAASGTDLTKYRYDSGSGLYIPNPTTGSAGTDPAYEADQKTINDAFANQVAGMDAATRNLISSINGIYSARIADQADANKRELATYDTINTRFGTSRYAPGVATGVLTADERVGLDRIAKIAAEEAGLIAQANQSLTDKKYAAFVQQRNELNDLRKEKVATLQKLQDRAYEEQKAKNLRTQQEADDMKKNINSILIEAGKNNAPQDVINKIKNSTDLAGAVNSAGEYLQSGSGIVGEYAYYKKDAIARGTTPLSFDDYQTRDANRKISIAQAAVQGTGLDTKQQTVFNSIVNKVEASPAIKALDRANQLKNILLDAKAHPENAGAQLNLLYAYIKGLDTDSAVREGELDLVKSISSYGSKYAQYFNRLQNNQAVPNGIMKDMISGGEDLIESIEDTANRKLTRIDAQAKANGTQVYNAWTQYKDGVAAMGSLSDEIANAEATVQNAITAIKETQPTIWKAASEMMTSVNPSTGQPYSPEDILQAFPELKNQ